jgi:hypothetical protein
MSAPARRRFLPSTAGTAAMEFALLVPVLLLFIGAIVEFGRLVLAYQSVNRLASRYALTYADCYDSPSGACGGGSGNELAVLASAVTIKNIAPQLNPTPVPRIFEVQMSTGTPSSATIIYSSVSGGLLAAELTQAQAAIGPGQYGVVVTVQYQYTLSFFAPLLTPFIPLSARTFSYTVAQRKN